MKTTQDQIQEALQQLRNATAHGNSEEIADVQAKLELLRQKAEAEAAKEALIERLINEKEEQHKVMEEEAYRSYREEIYQEHMMQEYADQQCDELIASDETLNSADSSEKGKENQDTAGPGSNDIKQGSFVMASRVAPSSNDHDLDIMQEPDDVYEAKPAESESPRKGGYISSISIENFKGIGEKVTIPLKPITLMFGANSAGKSTVLQALLYAHEVLTNRNPDADKTQYGGEWINLGGFRNLVHDHDPENVIKIGFEYMVDDDGLPLYGPDREISKVVSDSNSYADNAYEPQDKLYVEFSVKGDHGSNVYVSEYLVMFSGKPVASITTDAPQGKPYISMLRLEELLDFEGDSEVVQAINHMEWLAVEHLNENVDEFLRNGLFEGSPVPEQLDRMKKDDPERYKKLKTEMVKASDCIKEEVESIASWSYLELADGNALPHVGELLPLDLYSDPHVECDSDKLLMDISSLLSSVIVGPCELISNAIDDHRYIGPLRSMPPRNYMPQQTKESSRWADGMAGWDILYADILSGQKWFDPSQLDKLGLGYCFEVGFQGTINESEYNLLVGLSNSFEREIEDAESQIKWFGQTFKDGKKYVRMKDCKNGVYMEPSDVGTGISQIIPIIAGAMSPGCNFLSVEQPELHLHPAIQCNLGDLFISQMNRYPERTFLLETHSEHLILRLLRRIRETTSEDVSDKTLRLTNDHVGVIYVEELEDNVRIRELRVGSDGEFIDEWPNGFFEEDFNEIVGGL